MNIRPEDLTRIHKELEQEQEPQNPVDKAMESAELIRENIKAIRGERYLRLVDIGVLIQKSTQLNAFLAHGALEDEQVEQVGHITAAINSKVINNAANLYNSEFDGDQAVELLGWIDRIVEAEKAGVEKHIAGLMADDE